MLSKFFNTSKIGKVILYRVVLFSSAVTLLLSGFQLYIEFIEDFTQVEKIQHQIDSSYLKSVETAVWVINEAQAAALLEGIVALPTVEKAAILNKDGSEFLVHGNGTFSGNILYEKNLYSPITQNDNVVAILHVYQSHKGAYIKLKNRLFIVLLSNFVKTFLVASFILFSFHNLVAKHLIDISRFIKENQTLEDHEPIVLDRKVNFMNQNDELDTLVQEFNSQERQLKQSWKELAHSENRYRELTEGSLQGIIIVNSDWNSIYANKQFFQILGLEETDEINLKQFFSNEAVESVDNYISQQKNDPLLIDEIEITKEDNSVVYVQAILMKSFQNNESAIQIVIFDISDIKELKQKQKHIELELIQKNKMAAIGTMLIGVTHEVNNPNHLINQNALILKETWEALVPEMSVFLQKNPEETYNNLNINDLTVIIPELIGDIQIGSERITSIVGDLKSFVREDQTLPITQCDLNETIESTVHMLRMLINKSCTNFQLDLAGNLPKIWCYEKRITQVFTNLLINAIEAITDPTKLIKVSTKFNTSSLTVTFYDQGVGIDKKIRDKIFDAFYTTKINSGGTGLGLAICQSIIVQHHTEIKLNEKITDGTEFSIKFPLNKKPMKDILGIE